MNEKLKRRAEAWKGNFITIDTVKISNREMLEDANIIITSLIHNAESASKSIKELTEREAKLVATLSDIAGYNDTDGNSMMCDTHEECQNVAKATLSELGGVNNAK